MNQLIEKLVSIKRTRNQQKIFQQIRKQYRTRKFILNEIVNTERKYLEDLKLIQEILIDKYIKINGTQESKKVFSNLGDIIKVNEIIFDKLIFRLELENKKYIRNYKLQNNISNLYGHENSMLFFQKENTDILQNFECYFEYCEYYDSAYKYRIELKKQDNYFRQLVAEAEKNSKLQSLELEDLLVKPIQRLPKYILLLKDLKKNTPNIEKVPYLCWMKDFVHPDYENICKYLTKFEEINDKNNEKIGEFQNKQKMIEIQKLYGSHKLIIHNNQRVFIFEENVEYYINSSNRKNVHLICFNDSILLIENEYSAFYGDRQKVLSFAEFSLASEFNQIESRKGYLFKITTKNNVFIFVAFDTKSFNNIQSLLKDTFQKFVSYKQKMLQDSGNDTENYSWDQAQLLVSVEGTEEYNIASLQNYTVYIIKITLQGIEWIVYLRFSQIQSIYKAIISQDSNANVVKLQGSNWFRNHNNKYLDSLKINIEGLIQSIFQWKKIDKYQQTVLKLLGLPVNFHLLPRVIGSQNDSSKLKGGSSLVFENYEDPILGIPDHLQQRLKEELQLQKLLKRYINESEQILSRKVRIMIPACFGRNVELQLDESKVKLELDMQMKFTSLIINVDSLMKAMELCEIVANTIQLKIFYDFRLVVTDTRGNRRTLDHSQIVLQSLPNDNTIYPEQGKQFITWFDETYQLEFCKYIYFPQKIEAHLYKNDISRLVFVCEDVFKEAKNLDITNQEYALLYTLHILIYNVRSITLDGQLLFQYQLLQKLVPPSVRKSWLDSTWNKNAQSHLKVIYPKVLSIIKQNEKLIKDHDLTHEQTAIYTQVSQLARIIVMNSAFKFNLYGLICFYVGINMREEQNQPIKYLLTNEIPNLYLSISFNALSLLSPGRKKILYSFNLNAIEKIKVEPIYFYITIQNNDEQFHGGQNYELKFKTVEGYKISQLLRFYMEINQLHPQLNEMKKYEVH